MHRAPHAPHIEGTDDEHPLNDGQPDQHTLEMALVHQQAENQRRDGLPDVQP